MTETLTLSTIPEAIEAVRAGKPVLVLDDNTRENEGDAIIAAQFATKQNLAWMIRHTSGYLCAPTTDEVANRLGLPLMVADSQDPHMTAYTISVDAMDRESTGISATDRAHTLNVLADPTATPARLMRPGHVLPLRARPGGVHERRGHTEAAVDLMRLAGLEPVAGIAELVKDNGDMMRRDDVLELGHAEGLPVITVAEMVAWIDDHPLDRSPSGDAALVYREAEAKLPTAYGDFTVYGYRELATGETLLALVSTTPAISTPLVRVHSECATGDTFGSLRCECGPQLHAALEQVSREGGVVIYLRGQEGRGIGLMQKLRAYRLQEDGLDTVDANRALGFDDDLRRYDTAAAMLTDLGFTSIRLLTNNPDKVEQLRSNGIDVAERVPLIVGEGEYNHNYLITKRDRMGHVFPGAAAQSARKD